MTKGLNMQSLKCENRSLVLYLLNEYGSLSRKEIASRLGLTPAGVTKICSELIRQGYIEEKGFAEAKIRTGRKEVLLELKLAGRFVLGINAERDKITYSVSDLSGELYDSFSTKFEINADKVVEEAVGFLYNINMNDKIIAVGVCTIGGDDDYAVWDHNELKDRLSEVINVPVFFENNVKAFALSEIIYGSEKNRNSMLFFKWGPGIGSSIVVGGSVQSGNDNGVTEIGHYIVDSGGKKCRCGRYGCLETVASIDAIVDEIDGDVTIDQIISCEDESIVNIIDHKIDIVSLALTNMATILNIESIVLFGTMFGNNKIAEKIKKQCMRYNKNFDDEMVNISSLNYKSDYIGTTAICAKHLFFEKEV